MSETAKKKFSKKGQQFANETATERKIPEKSQQFVSIWLHISDLQRKKTLKNAKKSHF